MINLHESFETTDRKIAVPDVQSDDRTGQPATPVSPPVVEDAQVHHRLLRLTTQTERMEVQLNQLLAESQESSGQLVVLTHYLTDPQARRAMDERLTDLVTRLETAQEQLENLANTVTKLSRTQFKANTLTESKEQQIGTALAALQEIASRREQVAEARALEDRQYRQQLRSEARGELATDLLPGLDGLELALENGQTLLDRHHLRQERERTAARRAQSSDSAGVLQRLRRAFTATPVLPAPQPGSDSAEELADALVGWLQGLELVQERFLDLLAAEDIRAIPALYQPFNPRLHVAVETEVRGDVPPNTVVAVLRKGYAQGERVLRYAEVVVSRSPDEGRVAGEKEMDGDG